MILFRQNWCATTGANSLDETKRIPTGQPATRWLWANAKSNMHAFSQTSSHASTAGRFKQSSAILSNSPHFERFLGKIEQILSNFELNWAILSKIKQICFPLKKVPDLNSTDLASKTISVMFWERTFTHLSSRHSWAFKKKRLTTICSGRD